MFVEKKGHHILLPAFRRIVDTHPDARLHLFGSGPGEEKIRGLVASLDLGESVVLHGSVPLDELRTFLHSVRPTCVLPSIKASDGQEEGIPVTLVEAMANGSPVVSTRSGSIATLVIDGCGLLVAPGDGDALVAALLSVIDDPAEADARCHRAAERLGTEFGLPHTAARIASLVTETASARNDCS
jgi:colanic acid/amylovoran biosynthesis glycosyltransferase